MRNTTIICAAAALAGCTTYWHKPGGSEADFYADRFACQQAVAGAYPTAPLAVGAGYQGPTQTRCSAFGSQVNCTSTPGAYVPPAQIDGNAIARQSAFESCLMAKGYRKQ